MASLLATLVSRMEGTDPGDPSVVNNNPGNLRYMGQAGATGSRNGFAVFATPEAGWAALERQLQLDASRGDTLESFIYEYAPPKENKTAKYLAYLVSGLGVPASTPLTTILGQQTAQVSPVVTPGVSTDWTGDIPYDMAGLVGDLGQVPWWVWLAGAGTVGFLVMRRD